MRRKILQKFLALFCAVLAVSALFPGRAALAYVDYSGDVALTKYGAAYEYVRTHGGDSSLPTGDDINASEFLNQLGFGSSIVATPSSPFLRFALNYVTFVPFVGWRVTEASDISNSDSREAYEHLFDETVEFVDDEWSRWKEEYPGSGAGGGGTPEQGPVSGLPSGIGIIYAETLTYDEYTFADGHKATPYMSSFVDVYNRASAAGAGVCIFNFYGGSQLNAMRFVSGSNSGPAPTNGFTGFGFYSSDLARIMGSSYDKSFAGYSSISDVLGNYSSDDRSLSSWITMRYQNEATSSVGGISAPVGFYESVTNTSSVTGLYVITNRPIYLFGNWYAGQYGPSVPPDSPTGPTAPDYETPTPVNPTAPNLPNVTNNITNNPTSYTGSETDYSDYLKIIIDNQKEQIQQLSDWSDFFGDHMEAFTEWLEVWFNNLAEYLENNEVFWNTLFKWQKSITDYLYSIDQQFKFFRTTFDDYTSKLWGWLRDILQNMPKGGGGGTSRPTVSTDNPFADATDPLWEWLSNFINGLISTITAGAASAAASAGSALGGLSGIFPFSLLADLTFMLGLLSHDPVAPVFDVPYPFAADRNAVLIHVDLSPWSDMVQSLYPMWILLFALGLAYLSVDIIMALYKMLSPTGGDA